MLIVVRWFFLLFAYAFPIFALAASNNVELHHIITFFVIVFAFGLGLVVFSEQHNTIGLHFLVWALVCYLCAIPSFIMGVSVFNNAHEVIAMLLGILVFVVIYTVISSSRWFRRLKQTPQLDLSLRIGFAIRLFISIIYPLGHHLDLWLGIISIMLVNPVLDIERWSTLATFLITLVQGVLLNIVLFIFIAFIFAGLRFNSYIKKEA